MIFSSFTFRPQQNLPNTIAALRERLKEYRAGHPKVGRVELAERIGVNRHWLEKFEQGVISNPTAANLWKVQSWLARQAAGADAVASA